jgi:hypothetical protein
MTATPFRRIWRTDQRNTPLLSARLMRVGVLAAGVFVGVVAAAFVALACLDIEMEWDRVTRSIPVIQERD